MDRTMRLLLLTILIACKKDEPKVEPIPDGNLTLDTPATAAWMAVGAQEASGKAENVEDVTVNGADASEDKGAFSAQIQLERGMNVVEASATDLHGDTLFVRNGVLAGDFGDPSPDVEDAMTIRLNQSGLDKLGSVVSSALDPATLNGLLTTANPIYTTTALGFVDVAVDLNSVDFSSSDVKIQPSGGKLTLTLTLHDLDVDMQASAGALGYSFDVGIGMGAADAVVTAEVVISAKPDGTLDVQLLDAQIELQDFWYDTSLLPSWVTDYLLVDTIKGIIETQLRDQLLALAPPLIADALSGLAPTFNTTLLEHDVEVRYAFTQVESDEEGVSLDLDMGVSISGDPTKNGRGYLSAPLAIPTISHQGDVTGAISDNLLNRVFYEAWLKGMLDMKLSTDDGSLNGALLAPLHATTGSITTRADLPPVVVEADGKLQAQIGEMDVLIETPDSDLGSSLELSLTIKAAVDLTVEGGELKVKLGKPDLSMIVRASDWGASNEATTDLVQQSLPLDAILALLGNISFQLPSLYGITIAEGEASRDNDQYHTDVLLGLSTVP